MEEIPADLIKEALSKRCGGCPASRCPAGAPGFGVQRTRLPARALGAAGSFTLRTAQAAALHRSHCLPTSDRPAEAAGEEEAAAAAPASDEL